MIEEGLAKDGFDTLVLLIRARFRDIALACRRAGIRLTPKMNLMKHQSGKERGSEEGLLRAYPHFDETPDLDSVRYCRSLCPRCRDVPNAELLGEWEASMNATHPAVDLIPKDIICCDWHYTAREEYPSVPFLTDKGFRTVVCPWRDPEATNALLAYAGTVRSERLVGVLQTSWCDSGELSRAVNAFAPR